MHKIPTDAFDMLVTLEKRPFERAGREVVVRLLDETLPDGTKLVAASDPSYPPELAALEEHPAVLVHEGDLSLTERQLRVSIVGSRDASDSARADARRVARELAARGAVVVSGLAAGIDTAAHEGALEARSPSGTVGRTIAVMGTPLSQPWPPANARLARRIAEYGLLISLAPQVNGLSFTDEERGEPSRTQPRDRGPRARKSGDGGKGGLEHPARGRVLARAWTPRAAVALDRRGGRAVGDQAS